MKRDEAEAFFKVSFFNCENQNVIMMSTMKKVAGLFLSVLFLMGGVVHAQQNQMMQQQQQQGQKDYSEEEIDVFANAVAQVLPIQQEAEQKMMKEIEDQGMEMEQFNQIARQMQQGGEPEGVSEEQMQK